MTEFLLIFRSRTQAVECANRLKTFKIPCSIVNTPKEANVGCGLSVKVEQYALARARAVVARARFSAFYGTFKMEYKYGRIFINAVR